MAGVKHSKSVWLNKQAVSSMDFGFDHEVDASPESVGWQLQVLGAGTLTISFAGGGKEDIKVAPGNSVVVSGEEIFISLDPKH